MILRCSLLLIVLKCVKTENEYEYLYEGDNNRIPQWDKVITYWPAASIRNVRELSGMNEGGGLEVNPVGPSPAPTLVEVPVANPGVPANLAKPEETVPPPVTSNTTNPAPASNDVPKDPKIESSAVVKEHDVTITETENQNTTLTKKTIKGMDLGQPEVMMRGIIVFGGFLLLAVAYFIFYRNKSNKNELTKNHNSNDAVQFRYGVLQSEERKGKLELSRVPLTMESDDDEDEDLEIFDLGQKKKSLSYVNLQTNDEDVVFDSSKVKENKESLLLDIEDPETDTLINWTNNGNKSIL